jgi:hypothetical protein
LISKTHHDEIQTKIALPMALTLLRAASPNLTKGLANAPKIGRIKRPPNAKPHSHGIDCERADIEDDTPLPTCPLIFFNGSTN